jgi:hypothetical protein
MQELKAMISHQTQQSLSPFQLQMITDVATQAAIAVIEQLHTHDSSSLPSTPVHQKKRIDTKDTPEHMVRQDTVATLPQDSSPDVSSITSSVDVTMHPIYND